MKRCLTGLAITMLSYAGFVAAAPTITLIKSPHCGCCKSYVHYLQQNGFEVAVINEADRDRVKKLYGTASAASCHTSIIGGYVVEGHVPVGAIHKRLAEKPQILGISVPGMPVNSPGMGEGRKGTLQVYALPAQDGTLKPFSLQ